MSFPPPVGAFVSFQAEPDSVVLGVPVPGSRRYCGQVIGVKPAPPLPNGIPTCFVTVRGRSGNTASFDFTRCCAQVHDTPQEAVAAADAPQVLDSTKYVTVPLLIAHRKHN